MDTKVPLDLGKKMKERKELTQKEDLVKTLLRNFIQFGLVSEKKIKKKQTVH